MGDHGRGYSHIEQFSTQQLQELLHTDLDEPKGMDPELIYHILEVIEQRKEETTSRRLPDVNQAWEEFQTYYNVPEGDGLSLYPCAADVDDVEKPGNPESHSSKPPHLRRMLKSAGIVAIAAILVVGLLVTAQAVGFDIFGALGRWSADIFRFAPAPDAAQISINRDYHDSMQATLDELGIDEELVPTWYPEGFELVDSTITDTALTSRVVWVFARDEDYFHITVSSFQAASKVDLFNFEKSGANVEIYEINSYQVYIFSNSDSTTATWAVGSVIETIVGNLSVDEAKAIIDSIGG